jgi:hypothetical protein
LVEDNPDDGLHDHVLTTPVPVADAVNVIDAPFGIFGDVLFKLVFNVDDAVTSIVGLSTFCKVTGVTV